MASHTYVNMYIHHTCICIYCMYSFAIHTYSYSYIVTYVCTTTHTYVHIMLLTYIRRLRTLICIYVHTFIHTYAGLALRIGKLGNCQGLQSQRSPRVLTAKQRCNGIELCRPSMQLNCICISYFYSNNCLLLNEHSFITFISEILSTHTVK